VKPSCYEVVLNKIMAQKDGILNELLCKLSQTRLTEAKTEFSTDCLNLERLAADVERFSCFEVINFSEDVNSEGKKKPEHKKHGVGGDRLSLEPLNLNKVMILFKLCYSYC